MEEIDKLIEEIDKLIEKIESETLAYYSVQELIEILENLKHSIFNRNIG